MIISRKELLEAVKHGVPILNNSDVLTEEAMNALFNEMKEDPEMHVMIPLFSHREREILAENLQNNGVVIFKSICCCCGKPLELRLTKASIVSQKISLSQDLNVY